MRIKSTFRLSFILLFLCSGCVSDPQPFAKIPEPTLDRVRITEGPWHEAMELEKSYLKKLDPDRLLHHFRRTAGLDTIVRGYGGWESGSRELRGHSIGHYLSASSRMYQLTKDSLLLDNTKYIVQELRKCQEEIGSGYVSAFPEEYLDRVENMEKVWAPYYTLHKILAGLNDCYVYNNDEVALEVALDLAHYLYSRIAPLGKDYFQQVLDKTEQGGMNEVFWNLYSETGDTICKALATSFYQHSYFDSLAKRRDNLKGYHANSFIPNVVGVARGFEINGDSRSKQIAEYFWDQVVNTRSYITGGTSNGEHWNTDPHQLQSELGPGAHETCCTYNMLKLSSHLWNWSTDIKYQDYMERALINGILPTQNRETGMSMYYVSMAPGYYKTWGTPEASFWCCTGTGMENFSRIGEYLYGLQANRLYVNQFVSSELSYPESDLKLIQKTTLPNGNQVELQIQSDRPVKIKLAIRIPSWSKGDYKATMNGDPLNIRSAPGSYLIVDRLWKRSDKLKLVFAPQLWYSLLPSTNEYIAFGYGPTVLSARFGVPETVGRMRHEYGPYNGTPVDVPAIRFNPASFLKDIETVNLENRHFRIKTIEGEKIDLVPFYDIHMENYSVYLPISKQTVKMNNRKVDPSEHI